MNLRDINWRLTLYGGAVFGGIMWAVLASIVIGSQSGSGATRFTVTSGNWIVIVVTSLAVLAAGTAVTALGRTIALRSVGVGLGMSALAGWVMIGWIGVQGLFGA
jgi:hypothetical protein